MVSMIHFLVIYTFSVPYFIFISIKLKQVLLIIRTENINLIIKKQSFGKYLFKLDIKKIFENLSIEIFLQYINMSCSFHHKLARKYIGESGVCIWVSS